MNRSRSEDASNVVWGEPLNGLRLGLEKNDGDLILHLRNVGQVPLEVLSHVDAGEVHLDWFTLNLQDEKGNNHQVTLLDNRDESGIVLVDLAPGEGLQHTVDVTDWATREANYHRAVVPGRYQLSAVYDAPDRGNNWVGRLEVGPIEWTLADLHS